MTQRVLSDSVRHRELIRMRQPKKHGTASVPIEIVLLSNPSNYGQTMFARAAHAFAEALHQNPATSRDSSRPSALQPERLRELQTEWR